MWIKFFIMLIFRTIMIFTVLNILLFGILTGINQIHKSKKQIPIQQSNKVILLLEDQLEQISSLLEQSFFIPASNLVINHRAISIVENGGIFIEDSDSNSMIYIYPEKKNNQYIWYCIGVPSNRVPEYCQDPENNLVPRK